jgi:hypothetical protein
MRDVGTGTKWSMQIWNQRHVACVLSTGLGLLPHERRIMLQGIVKS